MLEELLKLLQSGQDSAALRFGIGNTYLKRKDAYNAMQHLKKAIELDPSFSAAWKLYAKALQENGQTDSAVETFRKGIEVAAGKGDIQAAKEMEVFLKRLLKE